MISCLIQNFHNEEMIVSSLFLAACENVVI